MSVDLYLAAATEEIQKKIQKNIEFAKNNPYPAEELASVLKSLGPTSNLAKAYNVSGKNTESLPVETMVAAKQEADSFPGLWKKLEAGEKGLKRLSSNEFLKKINVSDELNSNFNKFTSKIVSLGLGVSTILSDEISVDEFSDILIDFNIELRGSSEIQKAAFIELYEKNKKSSSPVSPEKKESPTQLPETAKTGSPINTPMSSSDSTNVEKKPNDSKPSPINLEPKTSAESTNIISSEGSVTSKPGEISTENVAEPVEKGSPININLEAKIPTPEIPVSEKNTTILNTSTSSKLEKEVAPELAPQPSPINVESKVENKEKTVETNNQTSTEGPINEIEKEKKSGGFLSKVGKVAKTVGTALNLPSFKELGGQATSLFGASVINTKSKISDISKSFSNTRNSLNREESLTNSSNSSINNETSSSSLNSTVNNTPVTNIESSVNNSEVSPNIEKTSNNLAVSTQNQVNTQVEKTRPVVSAPPISNTSTQNNNNTSSSTSSPTILNTQNSPSSQSSASSSNSTVTQNTSSTPESAQPQVGVNIDINQLVQSISRLERILLSGIDVTIKET